MASSSHPRLVRTASGLLCALLVPILGCGGPAESGPGERDPAVPVETGHVSSEDVVVLVRAVGSLEADQRVELKAQRSGRVSSIRAREGEPVEAGVRLVELDSRDLAARLDQARAARAEAGVRADNAKRAHERTHALRTKGIAAEQDYDDVKAELDRARAALEVTRANEAFAEAELAETVVYTPFAGMLGRLLVDEGAFVREGEPLGLLVDDDPLEIVFSVPERYVSRVEDGQPVSVRVTSLPDRTFPGLVSFVSPAVDPDSRTVTIKARIPNPGRLLRAGQFATVELGLEKHANAAVVPEEALVPTRERLLVFVVEGDRATARTVEIGVRLPGRVEIVSGLSPGETIVVTGHERLRAGESAAVKAVRLDGDDRPPAG